jgi:hypothetical protein
MPESTTPQFTDKAGRTWLPDLSFARIAKIRKATGIDFGKCADAAQSWAKLLVDDDTALAVIWLAIEPADGSVTKDDWLAAMDGPALEVALQAIREAMILHTRPQFRPVVIDALDRIDTARSASIAEAEAAMREAVGPAIERSMAKARAAISQQLAAL